jgi:hypothetical protein
VQWFTAFKSWIAWERSLRFKYSGTLVLKALLYVHR